MNEPITACEFFLIFYAAFVIMGSVYLMTSIPFLWEHYRKREKHKRKGISE